MNENMKKIILIILLLLSFNLYSDNVIKNKTKYKVDKTIEIGCKVLGIDSVYIDVRYFDNLPFLDINYELKSTLIQNSESYYTIFITNNVDENKIDKIFVHELIHLHQLKTGRLKKINGHVYEYDSDTIDIMEVKYKRRKYEIDAHHLDDELYDIIKYLKNS